MLAAFPIAGFHAMTEADLAKVVCNTLVEETGYLMAWIGQSSDDEAKSVLCTASAGDAFGYLDGARIGWGENEHGLGPTGEAIRTGRSQINQDFLANPLVSLWKDTATVSGFRSSIAVPIKHGSQVCGVLSVYSAEPNGFHKTESRLLELLASDLATRFLEIRRANQTARGSVTGNAGP